jgi:hypothetical protein
MKESVNEQRRGIFGNESMEKDLFLKTLDQMVYCLEIGSIPLNSILIFHLRGIISELPELINNKPYQLSEDGATSLRTEDLQDLLRYRIMKLGSQVPLGK